MRTAIVIDLNASVSTVKTSCARYYNIRFEIVMYYERCSDGARLLRLRRDASVRIVCVGKAHQ
jgi:hypothetical protein